MNFAALAVLTSLSLPATAPVLADIEHDAARAASSTMQSNSNFTAIWINVYDGRFEISKRKSRSEASDAARKLMRFFSSKEALPHCREIAVACGPGKLVLARARTANGYWFNYCTASTFEAAEAKLIEHAQRSGHRSVEIVSRCVLD